LITLSGSGGFQSAQSKIYADGYHGVHHIVDFVCRVDPVCQKGTCTAKNYTNWSDTSIEVRICDTFKDEDDPNTGQRNFVQDDGSEDCADEPTISQPPDIFAVYVRTIYFGDNDANGELSCGDTIFQVVRSAPEIFEVEPICECDLAPDATPTVIPRGGPLGFQATVTNNTDLTGRVYLATKLRPPPPYGMYPPSGFLDGPFRVRLSDYDSKSGHISHVIPSNWPLGTYIYRGYVGQLSGVVYDTCEFEFEVTP
jgi:hypothetical protein